MKIEKKEKGSGNAWRFIFSNVFILLFFLVVAFLMFFHKKFYFSNNFWDAPLGIFDFLIVVLATQRLTRLMVNDTIMLWFRDFFWDSEEEFNKQEGITYVSRKKPISGFRRTMADLLSCPWCIGVWLSLLVVAIYYLGPIGRVFIFVLAVASLSSLLQIFANLIGWYAEGKKNEVEKNA